MPTVHTLPCAARLLLMAPADNCLIAAETLPAGAVVDIDGQRVTLTQRIDIGHKLARCPLAAGDKVLRYGAPIGHATGAIAVGEHIHTHNLASDYLPTFTLGDDGHHFLDRSAP